MLIVCWSAKGGSGATVIAAGVALGTCASHDTALIDLAGDMPAVLGVAEPTGPGTIDWLCSADADAGALHRLGFPVGARLTLLGRGRERDPRTDPAPAWERLAGALRSLAEVVVVDAGTGTPARPLAEAADHLLLVTRPCFLALRHAAGAGVQPSGVVLVDEPGRTLRSADVERAVAAPIVAQVPWDPAVARAVDAGLLAGRAPRSLLQPLRGLR